MSGNNIRFIRRKGDNTPPPEARKSILKHTQKKGNPSINSLINAKPNTVKLSGGRILPPRKMIENPQYQNVQSTITTKKEPEIKQINIIGDVKGLDKKSYIPKNHNPPSYQESINNVRSNNIRNNPSNNISNNNIRNTPSNNHINNPSNHIKHQIQQRQNVQTRKRNNVNVNVNVNSELEIKKQMLKKMKENELVKIREKKKRILALQKQQSEAKIINDIQKEKNLIHRLREEQLRLDKMEHMQQQRIRNANNNANNNTNNNNNTRKTKKVLFNTNKNITHTIQNPNIQKLNVNTNIQKPNVNIQKPNVNIQKPNVNIQNPNVNIQKPNVNTNIQNPNVNIQKPSINKDIELHNKIGCGLDRVDLSNIKTIPFKNKPKYKNMHYMKDCNAKWDIKRKNTMKSMNYGDCSVIFPEFVENDNTNFVEEKTKLNKLFKKPHKMSKKNIRLFYKILYNDNNPISVIEND